MVWRVILALALSVSAIRALSSAVAQEPLPGDKVYYLHSNAEGNCPPLKWHVVAGSDDVLTGVVTSDDGKLAVMLAGTINPIVNVERGAKSHANTGEARTFEMLATEIGSKNRIAEVKGTVESNGWLNANIKGAGVACDHMRLPLFVPSTTP